MLDSTKKLSRKIIERETSFFAQTIDAIALQMCLERMEPCEDVEYVSRRQGWCDQVLSVKIPVEEMISRSSTGGEARMGEKTESIIRHCGYDFIYLMFQCERVGHLASNRNSQNSYSELG